MPEPSSSRDAAQLAARAGPSSWTLALDLRPAPLVRVSGPRDERHGIQLSSRSRRTAVPAQFS